MRNIISIEPFAKFSSDFLQSKLNKYKNIIQKGTEKASIKSLLSRILQLQEFPPPSLSQLNSEEWNNYSGNKLIRYQAKDLNLLGSILPYNVEGKFELTLEFNEGLCAKRGNLILADKMKSQPKILFNYCPSSEDNLSLLLLDCDHISTEKQPIPFILWKIDHLGEKTENDAFPYMQAFPERGSGIHRIVAILVKYSNVKPIFDRESLNITEFLSNHAEIISYNFYQTIWTKCVSETLKLAKVEERVFGDFYTGPVGCSCSFMACLVLQPFDVIKTQIQESSHIFCLNEMKLKKPKSYLCLIKNVYSTNGIRGFWKGLTPTIFRNVPGTGLYFFGLESLKKAHPSESLELNLIYGSVSRVLAGQCLMPFTLIKIKMESGRSRNENCALIVKRIFLTEGVRGFFKGSIPTILRDGPGAGLYYMAYEKTKSLFSKSTYQNHFVACNFIASINSSIISMIITNPFDVIKTRIQLINNQSKSSPTASSTWTVTNLSNL